MEMTFISANNRHGTNFVLMLAHRLRYWSNIKTELALVFVFSGTSPDIEDHEVIKIPEASNKRQPSDFTPANTSTI